MQRKPTTSEYISVSKSKIHRHGVFAAKDIPKEVKIIEYVGELVPKKTSGEIVDKTIEKYTNDPEGEAGVFVFELNKDYDINGDVPYNTAKNINHSCNPNCEIEIKNGHIWIKSLKAIKKGEELGYDYGYGFEDFHDHPCKCGSGNCAGYIVSEDERLRLKKKLKHLKKKVKRKEQKKIRKQVKEEE